MRVHTPGVYDVHVFIGRTRGGTTAEAEVPLRSSVPIIVRDGDTVNVLVDVSAEEIATRSVADK
jgi:hypothetical protein